MSHEDPGDVKYSSIGGLGEQIRELREVSNCCLFVLIHPLGGNKSTWGRQSMWLLRRGNRRTGGPGYRGTRGGVCFPL